MARLISILICLVLSLTALPASGYAAEMAAHEPEEGGEELCALVIDTRGEALASMRQARAAAPRHSAAATLPCGRERYAPARVERALRYCVFLE